MSTSVLRSVLVLSAMAALSSLGACTQNTAIGHVGDAAVGPPGSHDAPPGRSPIDPGPDCDQAAQIFADTGCIGCHAGAGVRTLGAGFDMEAAGWAQRLVGASPSSSAPATAKCGGKGPYLVAGKLPATGLFLDKLRPNPPCGVQMPQVGPKLTDNLFQCIQRWANNVVAAAGGFDPGDAGPPDVGGDSVDPALGCAEAPQVFLNKGCVACHGGAGVHTLGGGFDFETEPLGPRLIGMPSSQNTTAKCGGKGPYLVANKLPATGLFLDKLRPAPPCGVQMPQVGGKLSPAEFECIQRWANQLVASAPGFDGGASSDAGPVAPPDVREEPFPIAPEMTGTWTGYFEAFALPSGSDAIQLSLLRMPDGSGRVEVVLAPEISPPAVTDPSAPWPSENYQTGHPSSRMSPPFVEGVVYQGRNVQLTGRRLRFGVAGAAAWQSWCSQQMVYPVDSKETGYSCVPGKSVDRRGDKCFLSAPQTAEVSCARGLLCTGVDYCECYGSGCIAAPRVTLTFDMTFDANNAAVAGTVNLGTPATIRLIRTAP